MIDPEGYTVDTSFKHKYHQISSDLTFGTYILLIVFFLPFTVYIHCLLEANTQITMGSLDIPQTQTVALIRSLGGQVEFKTDYPVPTPNRNEVLAKILYTGVCQSGMYTRSYPNRP